LTSQVPPAPRNLPEVENLIMEQSSSRPPRFDPQQESAPSGRGSDSEADAKDESSQRMIADRLMAALASGNLEHLAHARQAFLKQDGAEVKQFPADLGAQLERRS